MNQIKIRPYSVGDDEKIVQLLEHSFDGWPKFDLNCTPLDHWLWKFTNNPLKTDAICLGIIEDEIRGCAHTIPKRLKLGDNIIISGNAVDVGVHPQFRGMGIWKVIDEGINELRKNIGLNLSTVITGNPRVIESLTKIYPRFPHEIIEFIRIEDIELHLKMMQSDQKWLKKYGYFFMNLYYKLKGILKRSNYYGTKINISDIKIFNEKINVFWEEIKNYYNFIIERNMDYLNWRYCDYRAGEYLIKQAEEGGRVVGYVVLRINKYNKDYSLGYIIDLLALPERLDIVEALLFDAVRYFQTNKVNIVKALLLSGHPYQHVFEQNKFIMSPHKMNIFLKLYDDLKEDMIKFEESRSKNMHFVYGDYDHI